jgi:hypothetical protein
MSLKAGEGMYWFGKSLLAQIRENDEATGIFGEALAEQVSGPTNASSAGAASAQNDEKDKAGTNETEETAPNPSEKDNDAGRDEDAESIGSDEGDESDAAYCWQILDLARVIFEKEKSTECAECIDIHEWLGDLSMIDSNFEVAITEYGKALASEEARINREEGSDNSRLKTLHSLMAVCHRFLHQYSDAIQHHQANITLYKGSQAKTKEEQADNEAILTELEEQIADLIESMKKEKAETAALRNSLEQTLMAVSAAVQKGDNNNNSSGVGEGGDSKGKEKEKEKARATEDDDDAQSGKKRARTE